MLHAQPSPHRPPRLPMQAEVERLMAEDGMGELQALRHLQARTELRRRLANRRACRP